jgi:hypothetical protein
VTDQSKRTLFYFISQRKDKGRGKERLIMSLLITDKGAAMEGVRRKGRNLYVRLRKLKGMKEKEYMKY